MLFVPINLNRSSFIMFAPTLYLYYYFSWYVLCWFKIHACFRALFGIGHSSLLKLLRHLLFFPSDSWFIPLGILPASVSPAVLKQEESLDPGFCPSGHVPFQNRRDGEQESSRDEFSVFYYQCLYRSTLLILCPNLSLYSLQVKRKG